MKCREEPDEDRDHFSKREDASANSFHHNEKHTNTELPSKEGHQIDNKRNDSLSSDNALERASAIRLLCTHELGDDLFKSLYKYEECHYCFFNHFMTSVKMEKLYCFPQIHV